ETNTEATVLGFVSEVSVEHLPLSYLRSLDDLIDVVWDNGSVKQPDSKRSLTSRIRVWLERKIASGWQLAPGLGLTTLELSADVGYRSESHLRDHEIVGNDSADIFWRKIENLWVTDPQNPSGGSRIEKDISEYLGGQPIGLKIAVVESKNENFAIQARVFSRENNIQLPCSIQLRGITANGDCFSQVESRVTPLDDYIRICFIAEPQESFQIEVTWNNYKFVESFPSLESSPF
nr:DUF1822 family protein [Elainella sp. Prado103]